MYIGNWFKKEIKAYKCQLKFLLLYLPDLNLIELIFGLLKV